ncbi:MAG: glycosyltransferase [Bacteroidota bacterium]
MTIVVYIPCEQFEMDALMREIFPILIIRKPDHSFFFLVTNEEPGWIPNAGNVTSLVVPFKPQQQILQKWWEFRQLPKLLKQHNASILISAAARYFPKIGLPQFLLIGDKLGNLTNKNKLKQSSLQKAACIGVLSGFTGKQLQVNYALNGEKICTIPVPILPQPSIIGWQEKEAVKDQQTDGKDFFLYQGTISPANKIVNLLKAFSLFKKRQHSNMQLVLAGTLQWPENDFEKKLNTYKFRSDVKIIINPGRQVQTNLMNAAYALINMNGKPGFSSLQLEAMVSSVPVISVATEAEPGEGVALFADADNPEKIADQMKLLYKDEHLRSELIGKGLEHSKRYDADLSANIFWECIEQCIIAH